VGKFKGIAPELWIAIKNSLKKIVENDSEKD